MVINCVKETESPPEEIILINSKRAVFLTQQCKMHEICKKQNIPCVYDKKNKKNCPDQPCLLQTALIKIFW
jgi:hypothetical protein